MKQAVMFGAGNIGRGFLGQLFSESGYQVNFVDVDQPLLDAFNQQGRYTIRLVTNESSADVTVGPVRGLPASDREAVAGVIAEAEIGATAVGAGALKHVAPVVAAGIVRRAEQDVTTPFNLIICENLKHAAHLFRDMVENELPSDYHAYLDGHIGFVDTVIARMVPPLPPQLRAQDPSLIVVEPYKELPVDAAGFVGPPPAIVGMQPVTPFAFYTERKLYMHNAGHAVLGYLGYQRGYEYGYEALQDTAIAAAVRGAMQESQQALEQKYGLARGAITPYLEDALARFHNRALGDTIFRLSRDPIRKLAPNDRLIGAALTALEQGVQPVNLVRGIAAALRFDPPEDPIALQLQDQLQRTGLEAVLKSVCGLAPDSPLAEMIKQQFRDA
ncbi:MAG: mannitol-1-phosphate 5-dehydrogenase [Anaerolineae bacterium]|nr:mannitol-1-phosphate 5-dehydrogenase [Anaerolineales bacterium]MCQ3976627.1 mannitol-1-phosphate 5-dehydrogenase [Anaerolineae bacterium]